MRKKDKESKITYIFKGWQSIFDAEDWISIQMSLPFFQDTEASRCLLVCASNNMMDLSKQSGVPQKPINERYTLSIRYPTARQFIKMANHPPQVII